MPVAKMYTAKSSVATVSEGLECFGGQGYIEDTGLPGMFRDSQVLPIWEGTSNVMSLDVLRALSKSKGECYRAFASRIQEVTANAKNLPEEAAKIGEALKGLTNIMSEQSANPELLQVIARDLTQNLAHLYIACLLLEHAASPVASQCDRLALKQWVSRHDLNLVHCNLEKGVYEANAEERLSLIYDSYDENDVLSNVYDK